MSITKVTGNVLADDAVTAVKIPANAVGSSEIAADAVGSSEIAANAVTATEIADNSVTGAKIALGSDARGDIMYYDGTNYARLAKGSSGQVLKMGSDDPAWGTDSAVDLTADQTWTGSQRATMVTDNDGSFNMNDGNNFKCTTGGNIQLAFTNNTSGQSGFIILINSSNHTITKASSVKADANLLGTCSVSGTYVISYISDGSSIFLTNSAALT
tara:strand:- start:4634 stop:5275 length:642 start_codon:yes stop_codon:yes gene_type:complete